MKKKRGFLDGYKTYNPDKEGYGDASQWQETFSFRMGFEKAKVTLGSKDPYVILEVSRNATWEEIKKSHRQKVMQFHPDRNLGDEIALKKFLEVQAAFEVLEKKMKV